MKENKGAEQSESRPGERDRLQKKGWEPGLRRPPPRFPLLSLPNPPVHSPHLLFTFPSPLEGGLHQKPLEETLIS